MNSNRPPIERRASIDRAVVDRTPRAGNRLAFIVLGLSMGIGLVYLLASGLPNMVKNIGLDPSSDSLVTQISDALSDSSPQSPTQPGPLASLHNAVLHADVPAVNSTLEQVSREELNRALNGMTTLMTAASSGNAEILRALLAAGARTEARHRDGFMALDFARRGKHQDVIRVLSADIRTQVIQARPADQKQPAMPGNKGERQ